MPRSRGAPRVALRPAVTQHRPTAVDARAPQMRLATHRRTGASTARRGISPARARSRRASRRSPPVTGTPGRRPSVQRSGRPRASIPTGSSPRAGLRVGRDDRHEQRAVLDLPADRRIPRVAAAQRALVEPHLDAHRPQRVADASRGFGVLRCVAQEDRFRGTAHAGPIANRACTQGGQGCRGPGRGPRRLSPSSPRTQNHRRREMPVDRSARTRAAMRKAAFRVLLRLLRVGICRPCSASFGHTRSLAEAAV